MSDEIKKEEEVNIDEKINEMLNDSSIKTEEEKKFLKDVANSLKRGEMPIDLILAKANEASAKLNELTASRPEFELFVKQYQTKINDAMSQMMEHLKNESGGN